MQTPWSRWTLIVSMLVLFLWSAAMPASAQAATPPPTEKAPAVAPAANLALENADLDNLNSALAAAREVDREIANAELSMKAAQARSTTIRTQAEMIKLKILVARKLDPEKYDVYIVKVEPTEANGQATAAWAIRPRETGTARASPPASTVAPEVKTP